MGGVDPASSLTSPPRGGARVFASPSRVDLEALAAPTLTQGGPVDFERGRGGRKPPPSSLLQLTLFGKSVGPCLQVGLKAGPGKGAAPLVGLRPVQGRG